MADKKKRVAEVIKYIRSLDFQNSGVGHDQNKLQTWRKHNKFIKKTVSQLFPEVRQFLSRYYVYQKILAADLDFFCEIFYFLTIIIQRFYLFTQAIYLYQSR